MFPGINIGSQKETISFQNNKECMHSLLGGSEEDMLTLDGFLLSSVEQCQDLGKGSQVLGSARSSVVTKTFGSTQVKPPPSICREM